MFELRSVELEKDFPMLKAWWEARQFPPANPQFMPPTGLVVMKAGQPVCAGFLFKSDANAAIIGNIVSDPGATGRDRHEALDQLIQALSYIAYREGFGMVCCSTNLPRLMGRFQENGFVKTDEGVSNFGRMF